MAAYRAGLFPWPHDGVDTLWWSPDPRAILRPDRFHVSRRLARRLRQARFRVTFDAAFAQVIGACAVRPEGTWITPGMMRAYLRLHLLGWAHSVEVWSPEGRLAGGLYGLRVDGLFGAESMFHRATDASKIALFALTRLAPRAGISLIDVQLPTPPPRVPRLRGRPPRPLPGARGRRRPRPFTGQPVDSRHAFLPDSPRPRRRHRPRGPRRRAEGARRRRAPLRPRVPLRARPCRRRRHRRVRHRPSRRDA